MRGEKTDQNLSVFSDWVILDSNISTFQTELQKSKEGGRGDLFDVYCMCFRVRTYTLVCVCNAL